MRDILVDSLPRDDFQIGVTSHECLIFLYEPTDLFLLYALFMRLYVSRVATVTDQFIKGESLGYDYIG